MGKLLRWVGIVWALLGVASVIYVVLEVTPGLVAALAALASVSPYAQGPVDLGKLRLAMNAAAIFLNVSAYVIPGLLLSGVGTLIKVLQVKG